MCKVLKVSRSSYYRWSGSLDIGKRQQRQINIQQHIKEVFSQTKARYGSPRLHRELLSRQVKVSKPTVAKYMRNMGLKSKYITRKYKSTTDSSHQEPLAPNILNREFTACLSGQKCVSDITYIPTKDGFVYLTVVMDLFNRDIIGWTVSDDMTAQNTVIAALNKAAKNTTFTEGMIFHSDRGVQYAAKATVNTVKSYSIVQSMSRKGNCWDNAVAESFFKSLKTELIYGNKLLDKNQIKTAIFEYIEIWYRRYRRHSYLDYMTIEEFNDKYKRNNFNNVA
jgi:transposase InsO family protein